MAKAGTIRGLQVFISDIRACQNKEQETKRVDKELAKIRGKFGDDKKTLTAYDRKKYVWKLLYIYMLGYDVEFGHKQACDLIPANKYSEKQVGYMACSILMNEKDEFLRLAINAIHNDLISRNEAFQSLALTFVSNIAGPEMAEALTPDVIKILTSSAARPVVRKKAALCLLRLARKTPLDAQLISADSFAPIVQQLLEERDLGLLLCCVTLLLGICGRSGSAGYEACRGKLVSLLERLVFLRDVSPDYTYYGIASPWLQTKVLRALQYLPLPEGAAAQKQLHDVLLAIFNACGETAKSSTINKSNAQHAILFEAISFILALDFSRDLLASSVASLGRFLSVKEPNIRYLALENLTRLALVPEVLESITAHQATILANLRDPDVSIRRRALDLLFTMCDGGAAVEVVEELVTYLTVADFSMREELVLKIAILAEKFAPSVEWYVDVVLALLERAGDFCSDDVWHRVVQLVTNNERSQAYAAEQVMAVLGRGASHEALVCLAAYVLGEYGRLLRPRVTSVEQFRALHERFPLVAPPTRALLLSTYLKMLLAEPGNSALQAEATAVFSKCAGQMDPELQQRSAEYLVLAQRPADAASSYVLPMPKWPVRESALLKRLAATEGNDADAASAAQLPEDTLAATGAAAAATAAAAGGLAVALGGPAADAAALAAGAGGAAAPASSQQPAAAAPVVPRAADIDLLGGDDPLPTANGATPTAAAAAAAGAAPPPAAAPPKAVDPLDDLFGGPVPAAAAPGGVPATPAYAAADIFGAAAPVNPAAAAAAPAGYSMQPTGGYAPQPTGGYGMQPPIASGPASGSFSSSSYSAPPAAAAAGWGAAAGFTGAASAGFTGAGAFGPASSGSFTSPAAAYGGQPPPGAPYGYGYAGAPAAAAPPPAAAAGGAVGFEDAAFGPQDDWRVLGDVAQWHRALLAKDKGILYEDTALQVGLQMRITRSSGELLLFLGNKLASQPLTGVALLQSGPSPGVQLALGQAPSQLAPKQQVQVLLQAACLAPFLEPPRLQLRYATPSGRQVVQELALPLAPHKFLSPEPHIPKEAFFERWKGYAGPPLKLQVMLERGSPLSPDATVALLRGLGFGVEHLALDPSPHNEAGAAQLWVGPPGAEQALLAQCRVEGNPQTRMQFRLTVAAPDAVLAAALRDAIAGQLVSVPPA